MVTCTADPGTLSARAVPSIEVLEEAAAPWHVAASRQMYGIVRVELADAVLTGGWACQPGLQPRWNRACNSTP